MKRKIVVVGSVIAIVILVLASFPSVVSSQAIKSFNLNDEKFDKFIDMCINRIQKDDRFKGAEASEMVSALQHIKDIIREDSWYPGQLLDYFILLLVVILIEVIFPLWLLFHSIFDNA